MANSRRGVYKKLLLTCPKCKSDKVVKNGHHHQGKLQYFCTNCQKFFYEDSAKGYPPTSIPFPIIAYLLYFRKKIPEFSNMRRFRKFVNHWLKYLKVIDQEISRQTIHHWINNYEKQFDKIITFGEARNFCKKRLYNIKKTDDKKKIPYRFVLKLLDRKFGKQYLMNLIKKDEDFFKELCEIVSKHKVFCWEFMLKKG
jgi:hypothetical protein